MNDNRYPLCLNKCNCCGEESWVHPATQYRPFCQACEQVNTWMRPAFERLAEADYVCDISHRPGVFISGRAALKGFSCSLLGGGFVLFLVWLTFKVFSR